VEKSPAFQFYPKDFIMDDKVAVMNMEARGVYITLLCYCWNNNGLPNDQEELKEMCGHPKNWDKTWKKVGKCFYVKGGSNKTKDGSITEYQSGGKLFNKRLDKEREKQQFWRRKSKEGGIKSGKTRRNKAKTKGGSNKTKGGSRVVEPKGNHSVSSSPSSSSSSLNNIYTPQFNKFWAEYPNKMEKDVAFEVFERLKEKEKQQTVIAARNYRIKTKREKQEKRFIKHPATFLRKNRWKDHLGPLEKEEMEAFDEMQEKAMEERK